MENREPELYREELLGGFYIKNAYPYEEWLTMKRGLAKEAFLRAIYEKMQNNAGLSVAEGETLFERYVQEDPLDERVYLRMMEIYESAHLYYKGIRLYQQLVNLLNTELRVAPRRKYGSFTGNFSMSGQRKGRRRRKIQGKSVQGGNVNFSFSRLLTGSFCQALQPQFCSPAKWCGENLPGGTVSGGDHRGKYSCSAGSLSGE